MRRNKHFVFLFLVYFCKRVNVSKLRAAFAYESVFTFYAFVKALHNWSIVAFATGDIKHNLTRLFAILLFKRSNNLDQIVIVWIVFFFIFACMTKLILASSAGISVTTNDFRTQVAFHSFMNMLYLGS